MAYAEDMDDDRLAQLIARSTRSLRAHQGWTQEEVAERLGWSRSKVAEIERGAKRITLADTVALCHVYEVGLAHLLAGAEGAEARQILGIQRDEVARAQLDAMRQLWTSERRERTEAVERFSALFRNALMHDGKLPANWTETVRAELEKMR